MAKMIDLLQFFLSNCDANSYYRKFYSRFKSQDSTFNYADNQEVIDRFRAICKPPEADFYANDDEFLLICFWLHRHGCAIKEFPNVLSRPSSLYNFAYVAMRRYIQTNRGSNGTVTWQERRELCNRMSITTNMQFQIVPNEVEDKIRLISTRGAEFMSMEIDEQLECLNNLIENLLKPDRRANYLSIDYNAVFFGLISEDDVKQYRTRTQIFRHATDDTLQERARISEKEKKLLVDFGIFVAIHLYNHLNVKTQV